MPHKVRPTPRAPMSVVDATRAFGSEVRVSLVAHFRKHPRTTQAEAMTALSLTQQTASSTIRALVELGVLVSEVGEADKRARHYRVDEARCRELFDALAAFALGD